ncbi:NAD(P)H-dependent flavin oxidoreductase [Aneurinibacillus tyrosinisolvens]|uniref:NAD(P)H-dependent flavin oxidoreductase n=1 Tax=Aneurinibacillus tyrosinisolvens TaxID=1443435 RepID=UPI00063F91F0|nr:nitronate monooxygenase [Aneurinibacillus tyrosinisolvens]
MWTNMLTERLGVKYPIIKAPMLGCESPEFVATISNVGGLGAIGVGRTNGEGVREVIQKIRRLTDQPFCVNFFIPEKRMDGLEHVNDVNSVMEYYRKELNICSKPFMPPNYNIEEQINVILQEKVSVASFTFGCLEPYWIEILKKNGTTVYGTATNVREAVYLEESGVDFIVAQGSEAGGHRGTFLGEFNDSLIGSMALIPQIVTAVNIPVIAAGGIMDGRGIAAAFALGALGVQMGTAFLTCIESAAHLKHKELILNSTDELSCLTRTFSGKPARGIRNRFKTEMESHINLIPGYPIQETLTRDIREAAAEQNNTDFMLLWAGQASTLSRSLTVKELIDRLVVETEDVVNRLNESRY